jgi:hypothetical protein
VVTCGDAAVGGGNNFKLLAALVNPGSQSNQVLEGEFFHRLLNFLNVAHVPSPTKDSTPIHGSTLRAFEPSPAITGGMVPGTCEKNGFTDFGTVYFQ